jgi:acetyltransferase-like isoleucine patch superfamily enzyme
VAVIHPSSQSGTELAHQRGTTAGTKEHTKRVLRTIGWLAVLPRYVWTMILSRWLGDEAFRTASQALSRRPGLVGTYMRGAFYRLTLPRCGVDARLEFGTILHQPTVEIGQHVYVGSNCSIGACIIEDDVLIGSNVDVISGRRQHNFDRLDRPIREQGGHYERIVLGAGCWIGNSSVIMANVGAQSIVGAGSVVTRDIPPRSIVAGNPATVLRQR